MAVDPAATLRVQREAAELRKAGDDMDAGGMPHLGRMTRRMAAEKLSQHAELCRQVEAGDIVRKELTRIGGAE